MVSIDSLIIDYANKNIILSDPHEVKSGKEATLYLVRWEDRVAALKVYKDPKVRSFKAVSEYIAGKYHRNPSERKAVLKKGRFGKQLIQKSWVAREFHLLQKLREEGAHVPEVFEWIENSILMEFIGENNIPASQLINITLSAGAAQRAFTILLQDIDIFLKSGIVHGDLSPYNILWWKDGPIIIDIPQAIDIRENPHAEEFLTRDLSNLMNYFSKFIRIDQDAILSQYSLGRK